MPKKGAKSPVNGQPLPDGHPPWKAGEEARENGRKGGLRSVQVRREKADLRKLCKQWLEDDVSVDKKGDPITGGQAWLNWVLKQAKEGNMKALEMLRDTAGFKPVDKVMVAEIDPEVIDEVEKLVEEAGK